MGETRVDLQHLLEDLRDAYTGSIEETILTEVVANALDSGATRIRLFTNPTDATLTIVDDGHGMQRKELARYHDVAASTKRRGEGIGFAGVGIKLGLLVSKEVVTETRRGATHVATRWHLASRHRAPWKWTTPPGLTAARGTAVQLLLGSPLSALVDPSYLEETLRLHFQPLLEPAFADVLRRHYPNGVRFEVNDRELTSSAPLGSERAPVAVRMGRRRTPSAVGYIERGGSDASDRPGVAISTFGKVIRRGWDWLGLAPAEHARITGVIEVSDLAACLTLNKNDFIRTGARGATYLAYRKAIQEVVSRQLAEWGDRRVDEARPRLARLERDLERVLEDLSNDFPLLRSLVDRRAGGQKRLPMPGRGDERVPAPLFASVAADSGTSEPEIEVTSGVRQSPDEPATPTSAQPPSPSPGEPPSNEAEPAHAPPPIPPAEGHTQDSAIGSTGVDTTSGRRRPARYGLLVQFESRPEDLELGRLIDSTIWINDAHPAYTRAVRSRSVGYHYALAVALALAPLAVEPGQEHPFVTQFLAQWGAAETGTRVRVRRTTR